jgi:[acyl-carrier-protein] S-malonyltransferase
VVNNIDVAVRDRSRRIRDALVRQAFGPVRWVEVVQRPRGARRDHVIECGPGKVLVRHGQAHRRRAGGHPATLFDPASLAEAKELLA